MMLLHLFEAGAIFQRAGCPLISGGEPALASRLPALRPDEAGVYVQK